MEPNLIVNDAIAEGAVVSDELNDEIRQLAENYITGISTRFIQETGADVRSALAYGNAANEILEYATKNNVDLIVMTTHGRSGITRWLFGNVADKVSHHSTIPVLIVAPSGCRLDITSRIHSNYNP